MPGTNVLDDAAFLRTFQVMDRVIQDSQPVFMFVWVGSIVAVLATLALGVSQLSGLELYLLLAAAFSYLFGVQLPTVRFNIPLNNELQSLKLAELDLLELRRARSDFEPSWNRWNRFRTIISCISAVLFLLLLFRH